MRELGLSLASHSGMPTRRFGEVAALAEDAGFSAVLLAEGNGDVLSLCHPVASATRRATVGTAIANAGLRHPVLTARTTAILDDVSDGRFTLGLGTANALLNQDRLGLPAVPALRMVEEYVAVVRAALAGAPEGFAGEVFRVGPVPVDRRPEHAVPIHLAALGPRMLALAGRIADGVILNLMSPGQAAAAAAAVRASAAAAGRDPAEVTVSCVVHCCLSDDPAAARAAARAVVPRYALHPTGARLFAEHDPADALVAVRERALTGDRAGAAESVPDAVAEAFIATGDASACRARVAEYRRAGVDRPIVYPMPVGGQWSYEETITAFGEGGRR